MLFDKYMRIQAEEAEERIRSQFDRGQISLEALLDVAKTPVREAKQMYEAAEWFEAVFDDDLERTTYRLRDPNDEAHPDSPSVIEVQRFIHGLRQGEAEEEELRSTIAYPGDGPAGQRKTVVVFSDHPHYPRVEPPENDAN